MKCSYSGGGGGGGGCASRSFVATTISTANTIVRNNRGSRARSRSIRIGATPNSRGGGGVGGGGGGGITMGCYW